MPSITPQPAESGAGAADEYAAIFHSADECGASGSSTESELSRSESMFTKPVAVRVLRVSERICVGLAGDLSGCDAR